MYQMKLSMSAQWEPVRYRHTRPAFDMIEGHGVASVRPATRPEKATTIAKVPISSVVSI